MSILIPIPKKGTRIFKPPYNSHLPCQYSYAQNSACWASTLCELRTSRYLSWVQKRQRKQRSNCQHLLNHRESKGVPEKRKIYLCFIDYAKAVDCVDHNKLWKILKEKGIPDHLTCLLRNLYEAQEATVRTLYGITDWFRIEKGVHKTVYCHPSI